MTKTATSHHRAAIRWMIASAVYLVFSLAMWWLVARTNSQGDHDAELLPLFSLIPMGIGLFHLYRSHARAAGERGHTNFGEQSR